MSLQLTDNGKTYNYIDQWGMVVVRGNDLSWRDSIGRTFEAAYCYGHKSFTKSMIQCWGFQTRHLYRHPKINLNKEFNDCSRDHAFYWAMFILLIRHGKGMFSRLFKYRISDTTTFGISLDLWLYVKNRIGLYYLVAIPYWSFMLVLNKLVCFLSRFEKEPDQATVLDRING